MEHTDKLMLFYLVEILLLTDGGEVIQEHLTVLGLFSQSYNFLISQLHFRAADQYSEQTTSLQHNVPGLCVLMSPSMVTCT